MPDNLQKYSTNTIESLNVFAVTFNISLYRIDIQRVMTYSQVIRMTAKPKNLRNSNDLSASKKTQNHIVFSVLVFLEQNI